MDIRKYGIINILSVIMVFWVCRKIPVFLGDAC